MGQELSCGGERAEQVEAVLSVYFLNLYAKGPPLNLCAAVCEIDGPTGPTVRKLLLAIAFFPEPPVNYTDREKNARIPFCCETPVV